LGEPDGWRCFPRPAQLVKVFWSGWLTGHWPTIATGRYGADSRTRDQVAKDTPRRSGNGYARDVGKVGTRHGSRYRNTSGWAMPSSTARIGDTLGVEFVGCPSVERSRWGRRIRGLGSYQNRWGLLRVSSCPLSRTHRLALRTAETRVLLVPPQPVGLRHSRLRSPSSPRSWVRRLIEDMLELAEPEVFATPSRGSKRQRSVLQRTPRTSWVR
jgi:hypothetical protein